MTSADTRAEIEQTLGMMPEFMEAIADPVVDHSWGLFRDLQMAETEISPKCKTLIGVAVSAALQCHYCTHFTTETAKLNEATEEEITEAVNLASNIRYFSTIVNGNAVDFDEFVDETAQIMDHLSKQAVGAAGD